MDHDNGDLYRVLGVDPDASQDDVRIAYRRIALECHPDRTEDPTAADRFRAVTQAYEVLIDEETRAEYDRMIGRKTTPAHPWVGSVGDMVDAAGIVLGSVMGAVRARREGRKLKKGSCPACQGEGELVVDLALISFARACPICEGTGREQAESPSPHTKKAT